MNVRLILVLALAFVPACSSSDPRVLTDEGAKAWGSGKWEESAKSYEKALAELGSDTTNPEWKRAKIGLMQAHTRTDAAKARTEFVEFAKAHPTQLSEENVNTIASRLGDAGKFEDAGAVLKVGKEMFPNSQVLAGLGNELSRRAKESGDSGGASVLDGLGYTGGK
ncbi:MAG: hypothetical protein EXS08_15230 [Planctomycetes bacterium]|nr:hypothetical protein [Planctomycetota bacterium]